MARHRIPTAAFEIFSSAREATAWLSSEERSFPIVVKADGLAAGKGVVVAHDRAEASQAVAMMMEQKRFGGAGERIVIEEFLDGVEASFFAVTDGERMVPLATCQDYKRALDGDRGPNTGGMGAYSPSIELDAALEGAVFERIMKPAISGLALEGSPYRGVLYAGLMLLRTGDGGIEPRVLEFNARFGDPETEVLMPRIAGDIVPLLASGAAGSLDSGSDTIQWRRDWSACVVLASRGYPESADTGRVIEGLARAEELAETMVFHHATRQGAGGALETDGGRILTVTALGATLREALERAYAGVDRIEFDGMMCRRDIGKAALARLEERERTGEP
jgi:phosphoribosylamine--glycine ligase